MSQLKINPSKTVEDFIQRPTLVPLNLSARDTGRLMAASDSSCAVVTLNDEPIGIVTEWDMFTRLVILGKDACKTPVSEVMSAPLWTVLPSTKVSVAISLMLDKRFRRLVVKDGRGILGVISLSQIIGNRREDSISLPMLESPKGTLCPFCGEVLNNRREASQHVVNELARRHRSLLHS